MNFKRNIILLIIVSIFSVSGLKLYNNTILTNISSIDIDVNNDSVVNFFDLTLVASNYGQNPVTPNYDVNKDGIIDLFDLVKVSKNIRDEYNINSFPRLEGEEDDYNRINRAINYISVGGKLYLPDGIYELNGKDISINKAIEIIGVNEPTYNGYFSGTVFNNGGLRIKGNNVTIENIAINCPNLDNGFEVNQGASSNISIKNCLAIARDHCFLFESFNGLVSDVTVENSQSLGGIHGFISKASNVNFKNCIANNIKVFAFGLISDNMAGLNRNAESINNTITDCIAINSNIGFVFYSRDYYKANNVIPSNGHLLKNIKSTNCNYGFSMTGYDTNKYMGLYTNNITIENYISENSKTKSLYIEKAKDITFKNASISDNYTIDKNNTENITFTNN